MANQSFEAIVDAFFAVTEKVDDSTVETQQALQDKGTTCGECGRTFKHKSSLREHRRQHTGELPFQCSYPGCELRFKWRSSLSNHSRYHGNDTSSFKAKRTQKKGRRSAKATAEVPKSADLQAPKVVEVMPAESHQQTEESDVLGDLWRSVPMTPAPFEAMSPVLADPSCMPWSSGIPEPSMIGSPALSDWSTVETSTTAYPSSVESQGLSDLSAVSWFYNC